MQDPEQVAGEARSGAPHRLDRESILETSRTIFHRDGLGALTLRKLGAELGVDATAMYRHFKNKAALLTALIDELFVEIPEPDPSLTWRDNLKNLMIAWWRIYRVNEGLSQAMAGQPDDEPRLFHLTEWTVRELIRAGVPADELGYFHQTIYNHAVGNGLVAAFSPWLTDPEQRDAQRRTYAALDPAKFPSAAAAAPAMYPETEAAFVFSVDLLLDAIEHRVAERACTLESGQFEIS
ncbi:TetR family transcriptional regulator [Leucobacter sp. gxy201]|uniref:TetR/AcrR family transcriptional regulator n=1 Tax=Leucobacter sp. gxy201 TaxID=2957200 RepID=UPI003D9FF780